MGSALGGSSAGAAWSATVPEKDPQPPQPAKQNRKKAGGATTIVEYKDQKAFEMARVASWALGGVQWKPRQPGQKGLRILSLDGGGTRGVLSIALLKEIMQRVDRDLKVR
jgi:hypothetical protein